MQRVQAEPTCGDGTFTYVSEVCEDATAAGCLGSQALGLRRRVRKWRTSFLSPDESGHAWLRHAPARCNRLSTARRRTHGVGVAQDAVAHVATAIALCKHKAGWPVAAHARRPRGATREVVSNLRHKSMSASAEAELAACAVAHAAPCRTMPHHGERNAEIRERTNRRKHRSLTHVQTNVGTLFDAGTMVQQINGER